METAKYSQDPRDGLRKGCHVFIEGTQNPEYRQIVMIDAPAVLGVDEWQKLDYRGTTSALEEGLKELIPHSQKISVETLAQALSGALNQISLRAGSVEAGDQQVSVSTAKNTIDFLLSSIFIAIDG